MRIVMGYKALSVVSVAVKILVAAVA